MEQVRATPWVDLEALAEASARQSGTPYSRPLHAHEQEEKAQALDFWKKREERLKRGDD